MNFDYGYDPNVVRTSIQKVNAAFKSLTNAACNKMQSSFVNQMGSCWAAPAAVEEFAKMKEANDSLTASAERTFQSVVEAMNTGSQNWASQTRDSAVTVAFESSRKTIDVSCIKHDIGGKRGIQSATAQSTANVLTQIISEVGTALDSAVSAVSSCGFISSGESGALQSSLNTIKSSYTEAMTSNYNSMKKAIEQTVEEYRSTSKTNTGNFTANSN